MGVFLFLLALVFENQKVRFGRAKNLSREVFACWENLYIFSRFGVLLWLVAKRPKLAGFAKFLLCKNTHFRLRVESAKFGFFNERNCMKRRKQSHLFQNEFFLPAMVFGSKTGAASFAQWSFTPNPACSRPAFGGSDSARNLQIWAILKLS